MGLITKSSPMATQGSRSEVKLVIDNNTITNPPPTIMISYNNSFITNKHEPVSMMIIANRTLMSLTSILTKFHAGYFRISLSLGGQALLWKTLIEPKNDTNIAMKHVLLMLRPAAFLVLWSLSLFILVLLSLLYMLRCLFFFNMVKVEFLHRVGVNYLFTPFISWLLLLQSSPFLAPNTVPYIVLWWVFAVPVVLLDVKIYGQWFTKGKRVLTMVANPTSQLSVIGNLVGAQAAANMGWKESAIFMFSLGMAHYLVLFVTLYQRLSGGDHGLPVLLRPALFLFFAAPCVACLAWESIAGAFDIASKMLFFLSLFLFMSLICRPTLFKRSMKRFNVAWWAYSFPVTVLALASTKYAQEVEGTISNILMISLSVLSFLVSLGLMVFTLFNAKMLRPENDPIGSLLSSNSCSNTRVTKSSVDL